MITPIIKDSVLKYLCSNFETELPYSGKTAEALSEINIEFFTFHAVMTYFERTQLLREFGGNRSTYRLILLTEANDFYLRGGFTFQEEILETNLNKLLLEVDNLKKQLGPDHLDTANKISTIASAIFSGFSLLPK